MPEPSPALERLSDEAVGAYFDTLLEAYRDAESAAPQVFARHFAVGGYILRVQAVNERLLARLTAALAHLEVEPNAPADLTILLWDSAPPPPSPLAWYARRASGGVSQFEQARFDARGELAAFNSGGIRVAFNLWPSAVYLLDQTRNLALAWIEAERLIRAHDIAAPFRRILSWGLGTRDRVFVHAAGVGSEAGGVLLAGAGGSGKSTSALACLGSPLRFAGDDYCLLAAQPTPWVYSLYSAAKLDHRADLARLPGLADVRVEPTTPHDPLLVMLLHAQWPDRIIIGFPLRAVLLPHISPAPGARLTPVSPAEALRAMASSAVEQFPATARLALPALADVVRRVPCFRFEVGPDVSAIPTVIERQLSEV